MSIDALMLENTAQIEGWHAQGYDAVDLETACLYTVGDRLGLECAALHIVSDHPFRRDTASAAGHMASLDDQLRIALDALTRASGKTPTEEGRASGP